MAASYPAGYDTMADHGANLSGPPLHETMHDQINDVLEAIEAELGLNPSGADATVAALLAALPSRYAPFGLGTVGYASTVTAQTGISSTATDLTSLSVTFTAVAGRRYKISASVRVIQNVGVANNVLSITDAANVEVGNSFWSVPGGSNGFHTPIAVVVPGAGSKTYKLRLSVSANNTQTSPTATAPSFILVEDIGT